MHFFGRNKSILLFTVLLTVIAIHQIWSFASGAPSGFAGAYADGGNTCRTCHGGGPQAIPVAGWITSNIPPTGYIPGNTYSISTTATGPGHVLFGFEITPMDSFGAVLGTMTDVTPETEVIGGGYYITHSGLGTYGPGGSKTWNFDWTAPSPGVGDIIFYGAFNVADSNGSNSNDTIYRSTYQVVEDLSIYAGDLSSNGKMGVFPNPVKDQFSIQFTDHTRRTVMIELFNAVGERVYSDVHARIIDDGRVGVSLPAELISGIYFLAVNDQYEQHFRKVLVSR